VLAAQRVASQE